MFDFIGKSIERTSKTSSQLLLAVDNTTASLSNLAVQAKLATRADALKALTQAPKLNKDAIEAGIL